MAAEEVKRFMDAIAHNSAIHDKVHVAVATNANHVAAIGAVARAEGYNFTDDEFKAALENMARELSDDELSHVAGGVGIGFTAVQTGGAISPHLLGTMKDA